MPDQFQQSARRVAPSLARMMRVHGRGDDGFSIIEVLIAMLVLTIVLAAGVLAVASSERVSRNATVMQQKTSIAQRAIERAEGDLAEQERCNAKWKAETTFPAGRAPVFPTCTINYDMRDTQGRTWRARVDVTPVDDPADGVGRADSTRAGSGDSDFQSRDYYRAEVTITLPDQSALAALPERQREPYSMASRLDWSLNEDASLHVSVCSHYRMDRSVDVGGCGSGTHTPVPNVTIVLEPVNTGANRAVRRTLRSDARGVASVTNVLPPGDYRVRAQDSNGFRFYRASPEFLKAEAGARHEVTVLMASEPGQTRVCYQITNADDGWGYWVNATNFSWQEDRSLVYRNGRLTQMGQQMRCQTSALPDPLGYSTRLFRADYAFSLQQRLAGTIPLHPDEDALKVKRVERDCLTSNSPTIRAGGNGNPARLPQSWLGMYQQLSGTHQLCFYFEAYPIQSIRCAGPQPGCVPRSTCRITYTGGATIPAGWDPCTPVWAAEPPTGPFNPCPGGRTGPLQKSGPDPLGTYRGPVVAPFGSGNTTYYGPGYECNFTASGERFDINKLTASTLTNRAWVSYGAGSCARVWSPKGEAIIKFNDTGGNPHALLDLSPGATIGLGYRPGDNPRVSAEIVERNVKNGQGCSAWNLAGGEGDKDCPVVSPVQTAKCSAVYPPEIITIYVKPEAPAGSANPPAVPTMGNAGASRRSL